MGAGLSLLQFWNLILWIFPFRCKQWLNNCHRSDLEPKTPEELHNSFQICANHFEPSLICRDVSIIIYWRDQLSRAENCQGPSNNILSRYLGAYTSNIATLPILYILQFDPAIWCCKHIDANTIYSILILSRLRFWGGNFCSISVCCREILFWSVMEISVENMLLAHFFLKMENKL